MKLQYRNSFWAYSASLTDYVPHINLLSFDNFATQFIHLWNSDKDFNQIVRRVTLNSAEYACVWYVSNIMAKKSYTTIENICISLHDTGLFTCTCTSYRNSYTPLLASKNDATHQNLIYAIVSSIQEKWIFIYLLDKKCWRYSHSDWIESFIIDLCIVRVSHYLYFSILYVSFWDESKGFCMAWWFCMTTRGKQIHQMY